MRIGGRPSYLPLLREGNGALLLDCGTVTGIGACTTAENQSDERLRGRPQGAGCSRLKTRVSEWTPIDLRGPAWIVCLWTSESLRRAIVSGQALVNDHRYPVCWLQGNGRQELKLESGRQRNPEPLRHGRQHQAGLHLSK